MQLTTTKIAELSLDPSNVRKHSRRNLDAIKASLRKFGQQKPIVVDAKGIVLAGNGTLTAAQELGWTEIQIVRTELAGVEATAFAIADNRTAELAEWEEDKLAQVLQSLKVEDADLLAATGYDAAEVDKMSKAEVTEDEVPEPPADPITKAGDLWILGEHRVLCGDSTDVLAVGKLMDGKKAETFLTDPPYGDNVGGLSTKAAHEREPGKGLVKRVSFIANDKDIDWLENVFNLVPSFLEEDSTKMVFFKWDRFEQIKSMSAAFGEPSALCVWDRVRKASAFFRFQPQHELCFHWGNQADKKEPADLSNVWRVPKELELKELHPTVKPMSIIEPALRVTTSRGKRVLDLFGGSGTTLIAAESSGRIANLMELDPRYCDVIVQRWENLTGKKAVLDKPTT
jgi:DNA modification methylase